MDNYCWTVRPHQRRNGWAALLMDNTFLQLISLIVSLSNQVQALQQENAQLKAEHEQPKD
jgi:hypothetical protein